MKTLITYIQEGVLSTNNINTMDSDVERVALEKFAGIPTVSKVYVLWWLNSTEFTSKLKKYQKFLADAYIEAIKRREYINSDEKNDIIKRWETDPYMYNGMTVKVWKMGSDVFIRIGISAVNPKDKFNTFADDCLNIKCPKFNQEITEKELTEIGYKVLDKLKNKFGKTVKFIAKYWKTDTINNATIYDEFMKI